MTITQQDIANKLGVTRVLVSRALSDHPSVAAETRARILETAAAMGYSTNSNQAAKTLIAKRYNKPIKTGIFAVITPASFEGTTLKDVPFFTPFFNGIGREATARGMEICLCPRLGELPRLITSRSVDGVVALGDTTFVPEVNEIALPQIVVDAYSTEATHLVPADRDGMRQATQHLIDLGHKNMAFIGHTLDVEAGRERFAGFQSALYDSQLPLDERLWDVNLTHSEAEYGEASMKQLLKKGVDFTAVVCYHDLFAIGAMKALRGAGLRVPEDVSVVGFDDISIEYGAKPPITSVAFDREAMARRAVQMLCDGETDGNKCEVFPTELMIHGSTCQAKN